MPKKKRHSLKIMVPVKHRHTLEAHFADFKPGKLPLFWTHFSVGGKHFAREYALPLTITGVFLLLVLGASIARAYQHGSLAKLLAGVTTIGQDYSTFLSGDKTDSVTRNNANDLNNPTRTSTQATNFGVSNGSTTTPTNTGGSGGSTGGGGTGGGGTTPQPFTAAITFFNQDNGVLSCGSGVPKLNRCSKIYTFNAGTSTQNGPGTVSYGWRSNVSGANEDGNYSAPSGSGTKTTTKTVTIACQSPGTYNMQFIVTAPNQLQSTTLNFNHNCLGL